MHIHRTAFLPALLAVPLFAQIPHGDPLLNRVNDPPPVHVVSRVDGNYTLFRIRFVPYNQKYVVDRFTLGPAPDGTAPLRDFDDIDFPPDLPPARTAAQPGAAARRPNLAATPVPHAEPGLPLPPDPDEFQFDPWDIPPPEDDFPIPDPPLPDPFDDPFEDFPIPDLPPPPDDELDISSFSLTDLDIIGSDPLVGQTAHAVPLSRSIAQAASL